MRKKREKRRGRPHIRYKNNSNIRRVRREFKKFVVVSAGSEDGAVELISDMYNSIQKEKSLPIEMVISNIQNTIKSLTTSSVRQAFVCSLTKGLSYKHAVMLTGLPRSTIQYARTKNPHDIFNNITMKVKKKLRNFLFFINFFHFNTIGTQNN